MSFRFHNDAYAWGKSSDVGWMEQYSVHTTAHPPSAFMPRSAASMRGRNRPRPVQWGTW